MIIERFWKKYIDSCGTSDRFTSLGYYTVDVKFCILMVSHDPDNTMMHRRLFRSNTYERARPPGQNRFSSDIF